MSDFDFTPAPLTGTTILAREAMVSAAQAAVALNQAPSVLRPIGLAIAFSQTPSSFIRNAKLGKSAGQRAFNALNFS